jgi:endonuclease/exonuclease/phosphatase family metal-dependent hydrolase
MKMNTLSISSFNLLNLNEAGAPLYGAAGWSQAIYDLKIQWTAHQIRLLASDVFGFQELWHTKCLEQALQESGQSAAYDVLSPPNADGKRIVCAALVRKGLLDGAPTWIDKFPAKFKLESSGDDPQTPDISVKISSFSRPVLHFKIKPREDAASIHVFVCHLKSKAPTKIVNEQWFKADKPTYTPHETCLGAALSTMRRTAEAAALRFILTEQTKGNDEPVIVLGDLNDGQTSNTINILTEQPQYLVGDEQGGSDVKLYTAQTMQEFRDTRDVYYTYVHQNMRESLDHILVSQELYDHSNKRAWLFDGLIINNDHLNTDDHKVTGTNDHGVIRANFKYKPTKST